MKEIILASGDITLVDDELYPELNSISWSINNGYAYTSEGSYKKKSLYMHLYIYRIKNVSIPNHLEVDHIDRNKLHNWFGNFRLLTHAQNNLNRGPQSTNTSGVKGIYFNKEISRWVAQICVKKTAIGLGTYTTLDAAKVARQRAEEFYKRRF